MIYALVDDLFFRAKIEATARAAGAEVTFTSASDELVAMLNLVPEGTSPVVIVDLAQGEPSLTAIGTLKTHPSAPLVYAYGSHVDREGLTSARDLGADQVMARSTLVERLPQILTDAAEQGAG